MDNEIDLASEYHKLYEEKIKLHQQEVISSIESSLKKKLLNSVYVFAAVLTGMSGLFSWYVSDYSYATAKLTLYENLSRDAKSLAEDIGQLKVDVNKAVDNYDEEIRNLKNLIKELEDAKVIIQEKTNDLNTHIVNTVISDDKFIAKVVNSSASINAEHIRKTEKISEKLQRKLNNTEALAKSISEQTKKARKELLDISQWRKVRLNGLNVTPINFECSYMLKNKKDDSWHFPAFTSNLKLVFNASNGVIILEKSTQNLSVTVTDSKGAFKNVANFELFENCSNDYIMRSKIDSLIYGS